MNAEEARKISIDSTDRGMEGIFKEIKGAAELGDFSVTISDPPLTHNEELKLKLLGYQVSLKESRISWEAAGQCPFVIKWVGKCGKPGHPYCEEHSKLKCSVCGEQATRGCAETIMGGVCGVPLCNTCKHH